MQNGYTKPGYTNKTKESITCQKPGSCDFWGIANSDLIQGKAAIPPHFNDTEVLYSASDKVRSFARNFYKNPHLDDSGMTSLLSVPELIWDCIIFL